ncbi:MAG TPA: hypothetical protein VFQ53_01340 [Kofleriaceae bacterium]|nr:hypothetical protein [Kofleriaceae bacterium]
MRSLALVAVFALVPALTAAAPRPKKKKPKAKAVPTKPEPKDEATDEPAPTPDAPADAKPTTPPATTPTTTPPATTPQTPAGAGSGSAPPPTDPKKTASDEPKPPKDADEPDVDTLRQEYLSLRDELFKSRARANAVASALYSTRIQIKLTYTTARYYTPSKATIRLDGASVFENTTGAIGGDDGVRFEGYVAPGRHLITFRVEATGKDDDSFTSVTESQIVVKAVPNKDLVVAAKARDGGDIAYEWKRKERGSYGLGIDVSVKAVPRAEGDAKGSKK